jgi:hypothetical protein
LTGARDRHFAKSAASKALLPVMQQYGHLREVEQGPDGALYILTGSQPVSFRTAR